MLSVLEFRDVSKQYRGLFRRDSIAALNHFSLTVEQGEIFGFLGPNGAGKTTAIHIALGLMAPSKGSGQLLGQAFGHARTRRRVGFLAENVSFYHRRAEKLVRFYGQLNGMRDPVLAQNTEELLRLLELEDAAGRSVSKLSRGMLQKVGLAQALVNDPDLLILDEPTSALDPASRAVVRELLLNAKRAGKTVFLSSHLLSEIELICDRVGILHRGRLARVGRTSELLQSREEFEIVARNVSPVDAVGAETADGLIRFKVRAASQRAAIERVWSRGGEIVSVSLVRRSLEEVFLSITSPNEAPVGPEAEAMQKDNRL